METQKITIEGLTQYLADLSPEEEAKIEAEYFKVMEREPFIPTIGPQTDATFSKADILLFGGIAGGGKTALGLGLAFTRHQRSLVMRRVGTQLNALVEEAIKFNGTKAGFNGSYPQKLRTRDGRLIDFGAAQYPGDELSWRGQAHDYLYIDEAGDWLGSQIRNLIGWVRTGVEGQRCRIVLGSNPPTTADGAWMVEMFAPWLDPQHANPAMPGELRWFVMDDEDDIEVPGPEPYDHYGRMLKPMSRTFIPSKLSDNPFLRDTDYAAKLDMMPEPLRSAVRDGNFMVSRSDDLWQVIPTEWIRAAQKRWTSIPPANVPMCAIGVDIAQGGCFDDQTEILTNEGWKFFDILTGLEQVLTLEDSIAKWGDITQLHKYKHHGMINLYESRASVNFCITDNHNLLSMKRNSLEQNWVIRRYDSLPAVFKMKRSNTWNGKNKSSVKFRSEFKMPNGGIRLKEWEFDFIDWARFLGWFISEGCAFKESRVDGRWRVNISQNKGDKYERIGALLKKMGIKALEQSSRAAWEFSINNIGEHLARECGVHAANKRIPAYLKNASVEAIEAFLEEYRLGDGTVNGGGTPSYSTTSKHLANDLQEILVKIGRCGKLSKSKFAGSEFIIGNRRVIRKHDVYNINEVRSANVEIIKSKVKRVHYSGYVYCVSTPLKSIMVRRKGVVMWSGNSDATTLAMRYDGWFAPLISVPGTATPTGNEIAGLVVTHRRDNATIIPDMGGGYGGAAYMRLVDNGLEESIIPYKGAAGTTKRTADGKLKFNNVRIAAYWKLREALDPSQAGGSPIALPPDNELVSDLTAMRFKEGPHGIMAHPDSSTKVEVTKRLGRSPDKGDAVIMAWWGGKTIANVEGGWKAQRTSKNLKVNVGYQSRKH